MKWTNADYPYEMNDLEPHVREKAIEIANQLRDERVVSELNIVSEAIKRAQEWFLEMEG
ncbi:DUF2188 domain-containing protein [Mucilaginibacter agri]|jgi:uncharacterized protein YdaT|uniref:hypothetical protein n=1 Tax=Mucilaginibacter agri TaxID=2695265 RepID=UPI0014126F30|nr:hypothetical protein [Mucilaginibacter agri]